MKIYSLSRVGGESEVQADHQITQGKYLLTVDNTELEVRRNGKSRGKISVSSAQDKQVKSFMTAEHK